MRIAFLISFLFASCGSVNNVHEENIIFTIAQSDRITRSNFSNYEKFSRPNKKRVKKLKFKRRLKIS